MVAKVVRDHAMRALSECHAGYGFERNRGYGTAEHRNALVELGPCRVHRLSYAGVRRPTSQSSGAWGEDLALRYLTRRGYRLVERNYRTRRGEIDLILRKRDTLVFVEVKLRRTSFGDPLEAVTPRKQTTLRRLAEQYLADREPDFDTLRFDVVDPRRPQRLEIDHIEDAF